MLEKETQTYEQHLQDLLKTDMGKFVLIKDEKVLGTFADMSDALHSGYERFRDDAFFVRQILLNQQPLNFTNNYLFV